MKRHPQDPQGPRARRFQQWLKRDPSHRRIALRNRLERGEDDTEVFGLIAVWIIVGGMLLVGIGRVVRSRWFPW